MKYLTLLFLIVFIYSVCSDSDAKLSYAESDLVKSSGDSTHIKNDSGSISYEIKGIELEPDTLITYSEMKSNVSQIRRNIDTSKISYESISSIFSEIVINRIIPYWYGTKWSFNGYTSKPKDGVIACGYFVSTTLLHSGLNLNRYKLAQQSPILEARSLALNSEVIEINNRTISENIEQLKDTLKNGIYFIGFNEGHVGFLYKKQKDIYLIHSNFLDAKGVVLENIENSKVFSLYNRLYIAELSTNRELIKRWITKEEIVIVTE